MPDSSEWIAKVQLLRTKIALSEDILPVLTEFEQLLKAAKPEWLIDMARQMEFSDGSRPILHITALHFGSQASPALVNTLTRAYAATNDENVRIQLSALARFVRADDALDTLTRFVTASNYAEALDPMLSAASFAIVSTQNGGRIERHISSMALKEGNVRLSLADGLSALKSPTVLPVLTAIIDGKPTASKSRYAKEVAIRLLGQIKDETSRDYLIQIERGGDDEERIWAAEARTKLEAAAPKLFQP